MQKEIEIGSQKINYTLRRSRRARRAKLAVYCDGSLVVTLPHSFFFNENSAERMIREKAEWVIAKIAHFQKFKQRHLFQNTRREFLDNKKSALDLAKSRIAHFNAFYGFKFNQINIKNQKTRWGSCSGKGNLNFNYKIALLPAELSDYIIVHELCHLGEFNHSRKFWKLVALAVPNYKNIVKEIRGI